MNTNEHDEQEGNKINPLPAEDYKSEVELTAGEDISPDHPDGTHKKKYHSSAMYAASKLHNAVEHVKPTHNGINL